MILEDREIVALYWARDEEAIGRTQEKYERYLMKIAVNILFDEEDGRECVNDTYLRAWNSMPDARPEILATYLGKITRRLAIDGWRRENAVKRRGSQYALSLEELAESLPASGDVETQIEHQALADAISDFLKERPAKNRNIFVSRYFFMDAPKEIARHAGMKEATVRSILLRERRALLASLRRGGFVL